MDGSLENTEKKRCILVSVQKGVIFKRDIEKTGLSEIDYNPSKCPPFFRVLLNIVMASPHTFCHIFF